MSNRQPSSRWPRADALVPTYGKILLGENGLPTEQWKSSHLVNMRLPYPMRLPWDRDTVVRKITCHREVQRSLSSILDRIAQAYPDAASRRAAGVDLFGGCYQYRAHRGSNQLSMHAFGVAFDFGIAPDKEGKFHLPPAVIDIFRAEGWTARSYSRHFEAINWKP